MAIIVLLGRLFYSLIFISAAWHHFTKEAIIYAASQSVPLPWFLVPVSGLLALLGGLSILLGYKARLGAWLIVLFLVPVTLTMHQFWGTIDPAKAELQQVMFFKNVSMLGGALLIAYFGSGPLSLRNSSRKITRS